MKYASFLLLSLAPLAYLLVCVLASAVLAYPLHFITQEAIGFQTLINKCATLLMVVGLIPLGRWLDIGKKEIGLADTKILFFHQLRRGFAYGALMLGIHVLVLLLLDVRVLDEDKLEAARVLRLSAKALLIGLAVAFIEEPVFRGFLFGSLVLKTGRATAVLISSFYFAALHFFKSDLDPDFEDVRWNSGLIIVMDALGHLSQIHLDSFLALFSAGALLACIRSLIPSGLGYCIGLHAGWVFIIKTAKPFTDRGLHPLWPDLASNFDGIIGYLSAAWISVLILLVIVCARVKAKNFPLAAP